MDSKNVILDKLSQSPTLSLNDQGMEVVHAVPNLSDNLTELTVRFVTEAERLTCKVQQVGNDAKAVRAILGLLRGEENVSGWSFDRIGVIGLESALNEAGIHMVESLNPEARYGITGVDAALAATGSIVLSSGKGKPRFVSLLPPIHIAVLRSEQIIQDLENWVAIQENFTESSNVFVISGPSKTADIAMELVLGMHGPQELHIILIESSNQIQEVR